MNSVRIACTIGVLFAVVASAGVATAQPAPVSVEAHCETSNPTGEMEDRSDSSPGVGSDTSVSDLSDSDELALPDAELDSLSNVTFESIRAAGGVTGVDVEESSGSGDDPESGVSLELQDIWTEPVRDFTRTEYIGC